MNGQLHMPCGCPYPQIGDHRPCEHGYNGTDDDYCVLPGGELPDDAVTAAEQRAAEALWKSGACEPQEAAALARIALSAALPELTRAITTQATTTEREACAQLAETEAQYWASHGNTIQAATLRVFTDLIRKRGAQ